MVVTICWAESCLFGAHAGVGVYSATEEGMSTRPYALLAQHYDVLFLGSRAPLDAARQHALGRVLPGVTAACDLACGTGTTALALARKGIGALAPGPAPDYRPKLRSSLRSSAISLRNSATDFSPASSAPSFSASRPMKNVARVAVT